MFNKLVKIYVKKAVLLPIKIVLLVLAFYSFLDVYTILDSGVAISRYNQSISTVDDGLGGFIASVLRSTTYGVVSLYFCFSGVKPIEKENLDNKDK